MKSYNISLLGATGVVGRKLIQVLQERRFPIRSLRVAASLRSAGTTIPFGGATVTLEEPSESFFENCDIAFFTVNNVVSKAWMPIASAKCGCVIDNSSAFRLADDIPLVVPEVNARDIFSYPTNIIANPNCSTIQLVVALKPLHDAFHITRVVVSTYQAVSGAGSKGLLQLEGELADLPPLKQAFPHPILHNALPHVAVFEENGWTTEENKMMAETRKILHAPHVFVVPTCVRVPVMNCHSESVAVEFEKPYEMEAVRALLSGARGIVLQDAPMDALYPLARNANERDDVFVGRLRRDESVPSGLLLWIVADNLRKGAASNAVQIAEEWIAHH
jgi:aspartate-semialdehyde dehydrogenase